MPWFLVENLGGFARGSVGTPDPLGAQVVKVLAQRLPAEMGNTMTNMQRKRFAEVIRRIGNEVRESRKQASKENSFTSEFFWQAFLEDPASSEFRLAVWGSQRISYGAIYHAYEDFVTECIRLASGLEEYRTYRIKELLQDAESQFGHDVTEDCVSCHDVQVARLVRNALAHNGGKETEDPRKVEHGIAVRNGELQIMAPDTRRLYNQLKRRAYRLAQQVTCCRD